MKLVPNALSSSIGRSLLKTKKNSPHIFFAAGVAGFVGTVVLASRATTKLEPLADEIKQDFKAVTAMSGYSEVGKQNYTESQYRKDVAYVYAKGAVKVGKLYAPAAVLGAASIACLTGSHIQLTRRNAALTATLAAVMEAYEAYRARIREELGEERELELYRDVEVKNVEIDGKKKAIEVANPSKHSVYARCFDEYNPNWPNGVTSEHIRNYLMCQQNFANERLQSRGHVLLNDVYDSLGFDRTPEGAVVGWVKYSKDGDGFIDFGIWEGMHERIVGNMEAAIWLDFNVDGVVYDLI